MRARLAGAALAVAMAGLAAALPAAAEPLVPGIEWIAGHYEPGAQPDGNSVILDGPDGLVLFDTGRHPAHAAAVIARLRAIGKPLRWIVNSHWHLDHVGGDGAVRTAFPEAGLLASDAILAARRGFLAQYRADLLEAIAKAPPGAKEVPAWRREIGLIDDAAAQTPTEFVRASGPRDLAGRRVQLNLETHAVTAGDVWLYDEASKVLVAGDLVTLPAPFLDTACAARWQQSLDRLAAVPFDWLVPGHGAPMRRDAFERWRNAFGALRACAASAATNAACIYGWLRGVGPLVAPAEVPQARELLAYYLDSHLRPEPAKKANAAYCPA